MAEVAFWSVVLRFLQACLQGAPFIFTGFCVMGLFHRLMGHRHTKWLFGSNSLSSLFQSWVLGMLLPGCSLGTIPIVKQLRRSGIAVGTIFAFALSSPLFDPLSLLYGLTLSKPFTILAFATCSLIVVTISGSLFDRWYPDTEIDIPEPPTAEMGIKRLLAILVVMARESVSSTFLYILIGLFGSAFLTGMIPNGSLQRSMDHSNSWAPLVMTGVAIPVYATPMAIMGTLGSMFQHGNSVGAAFSLLIFGAGVNLGLIVWMGCNYGWRKCLFWMGLMVSIVLVISYVVENPLYPQDIEPADHTHAFDPFCQPFMAGTTPAGGFPSEVVRKIRMETQLHEIAGAIAWGCLLATGLGLRILDRRWNIDDWLVATPTLDGVPKERSRWDIEIPNPVLAVLGLIAIVAFSIVGCFAYYPDPKETLEELRVANTEAFSAANSGNKGNAKHWIPICEGWNRRLLVGVYLRKWKVGDQQLATSRTYADRLEELEHLVEDGAESSVIRAKVSEASAAAREMSRAFSEQE